MKKPYQINRQTAIKRFEKLAKEKNPVVQLIFPLAEMLGYIRTNLSELMIEVGRRFLEEMMEREVDHLAGPRGQQQPQRKVSRWGVAKGYCVVNGQKVPLTRPRIRNQKRSEQPLGSYQIVQRASLTGEAVWQKMMRGLSTRNYSEIVREFTDAYSLEKSTVDEHFIECSRQKMDELLQRPLGDCRLCAIYLDGTWYRAQNLLVATGLTCEGYKVTLGVRQISTENAVVAKELLTDLAARGVDFAIPRLYVLDGGKGLASAVRAVAGPAGLMQRCQVHKIRNVVSHLSEDYRPSVKSTMNAAYTSVEYTEAKRILDRLHRELMHRNPSAARSLEEGLEETLTVHRLRVGSILRETVASTNPIESAFAIVENICRNVKRWRGGDQYLRWVASGLLHAEKRFNRVRGYRQIPILMKEVELAILKVAVPAIRAVL